MLTGLFKFFKRIFAQLTGRSLPSPQRELAPSSHEGLNNELAAPSLIPKEDVVPPTQTLEQSNSHKLVASATSSSTIADNDISPAPQGVAAPEATNLSVPREVDSHELDQARELAKPDNVAVQMTADSDTEQEDYKDLQAQGVALSKLGKHEEAIATYDKVIEAKPNFHRAWFQRGVALSHLNQMEEALSNFDTAIEIAPKFHRAWFQRGAALARLERTQEAIASFDKGLAIKPDIVWAKARRENLLKKLNQ